MKLSPEVTWAVERYHAEATAAGRVCPLSELMACVEAVALPIRLEEAEECNQIAFDIADSLWPEGDWAGWDAASSVEYAIRAKYSADDWQWEEILLEEDEMMDLSDQYRDALGLPRIAR